MQELQFDYYRGMEAEQYTFYRIPKVLFTAECFKALSCEAKVLYGLLLDRMSLSIKNRWFDEEDRVYIIFTVEDVMELLNCSRQKAIKNLAELDSEKGIGLIEKKRLGLGRPNVIYVKNFIIKESPEQEEKEPENAVNTQKYENHTSRSMENELQEVPKSYFKEYENQTSGSMKNRLQEVPESNFKKCENHTSRSMKNRLQEVPKSYSNNTDINKTDLSDTEFSETEYSKTDFNDTDSGVSAIHPNPIPSNPSIPGTAPDVMEEMDAYRDIIREHISYECFQDGRYHRREDVDELVELMVEVMMLPDHGTVRVAGVDKPTAVVKNRFMKLNHEHIEYILTCLGANTTKVGNIKAYLLTTLYNAPMTISNYYTAEVNHDLYGSG
ncbi:DUF6017 domain-containing protein [Enterocloster bolteae]|uniref:DUF6017 domain-containing protein n=1 Tax=Enterocloster bolteae TaxID=208479 RepID=UPI003AB6BE4A